MTHMLEELRADLIKLRGEMPTNSHRSKGILRRIDRALSAIISSRRDEHRSAKLTWP
ncbi:MAG: hypothetical protein WCI18_02890 [Pseudomonadota bacterium]